MILRNNMLSNNTRIVKRLAIIALLGLLFGQVDAQKVGAAKTTTSAKDKAPAETTTPDQTDQNTDSATTASSGDSSPDQTGSPQPTDQPSGLPNVSSSPTNGLPQLTSSVALPSLTTNLPKLTQNPANVPTYQVVIPQAVDNPFLQTSSFPEGTVFIVVGSCLAGLALMLIASRAIYIWFLHRQTRQHRKELKYSEMEQRPYTAGSGNPSTAPFTGAGPAGNNISLDYLRPGDRSSRVSTFSSRPSTGRPQTSSLRPISNGNALSTSSVQFYSPSAHPGGAAAAALAAQSSRDSAAYLPAGYYLRDSTSTNNNNTSTASPRQMYSTPAPTTSFLYSDPSATPIPRLSRSPTGNSAGTTTAGGNSGGGTTRPATASAAGSVYGTGHSNGGSNSRPISAYSAGQGGYSGGQSYPQTRRAPSSSNGETSTTYAGDRRSKPTQALDDLLGGR